MGQNITFRIKDGNEYIELVLDHTPQDDPFTGWKIKPHVKPSRVSTCIISYNQSFIIVSL